MFNALAELLAAIVMGIGVCLVLGTIVVIGLVIFGGAVVARGCQPQSGNSHQEEEVVAGIPVGEPSVVSGPMGLALDGVDTTDLGSASDTADWRPHSRVDAPR